ncbi:hypothetical protein GJ496_012065 [Pomphorhynchus laevis]|nr:hypothetical protein GJ496_012065 [Pomphorhynchus laevis]
MTVFQNDPNKLDDDASDNDNIDFDGNLNSVLIFPADSLHEVETNINRPDGMINVKHGCDFQKCMTMTVKMAKQDIDRTDIYCKRFVDTVMLNCFSKILNSDVVTLWNNDTCNCVYSLTLLLIDLVVLKINKTNTIFPFECLAIAFHPKSRIHQTSASGNVSSNFESAEYRQFTRSSFLPCYLANFINYFGSLHGFSRLRSCITHPLAKPLSGSVIIALLKMFIPCAHYISPSIIDEHFEAIAKRLKELMEEQALQQLPPPAKPSLDPTFSKEESCVIIRYIVKILSNGNSNSDICYTFENQRLALVASMLKKDLFNEKMSALMEINRFISQATPETRNKNFSSTKDVEEYIDADKLCKWIRDNKLLETALQDCLHQPHYVEKLEMFIRFLVKQNEFTSEDLELIWSKQTGMHETIQKNVYDLLAKLAYDFSEEQLAFLFSGFQASWLQDNSRERDQLLTFIQYLVREDKHEVLRGKVLEVLWIIEQDNNLSLDIADKVMLTFNKILKMSSKKSDNLMVSWYKNDKVNDTKIAWIHRLIAELIADNNSLLVFNELHAIINMFPELVEDMSQDITLTATIRSKLINFLNSQYNLLNLLINKNLSNYMKIARLKFNESPNSTANTLFVDSRFNHIGQLNERILFIRFLLRECDGLDLTIDLAKVIWQELVLDAIFPFDRDVCFEFFSNVIQDETWFSQHDCILLFKDCMLTLDPAFYNSTAASCFQRLFNVFKESRDQTLSNGISNYVGKDYLWKIVLKGNFEAVSKVMEIFRSVYCRSISPDLAIQFEITKMFLKDCFEYLSQSTSSEICYRILVLIMDYVSSCDCDFSNKRRNLPPLKSSFRGNSLRVIINPSSINCMSLSSRLVLETHTNVTVGWVIAEILKDQDVTFNSTIQIEINNQLVNDEDRLLSEYVRGNRHDLRIKYLTTTSVTDVDVNSSQELDSINGSLKDSDNENDTRINTFSNELSLPSVLISQNKQWYKQLVNLFSSDSGGNYHLDTSELFAFLENLPAQQDMFSEVNDTFLKCRRDQSMIPLQEYLRSSSNALDSIIKYKIVLAQLFPVDYPHNGFVSPQLHTLIQFNGFKLIIDSMCTGGLLSTNNSKAFVMELDISVRIIRNILMLFSSMAPDNIIQYHPKCAELLYDNYFYNGDDTKKLEGVEWKHCVFDAIIADHMFAIRQYIRQLLQCSSMDFGCQQYLNMLEMFFALMLIKPTISIKEFVADAEWEEFIFIILTKSRDSADMIHLSTAESFIYNVLRMFISRQSSDVILNQIINLLYEFIKDRAVVLGKYCKFLSRLVCRLLELCQGTDYRCKDTVNEMLRMEVEFLMIIKKSYFTGDDSSREHLIECHLCILTQLIKLVGNTDKSILGIDKTVLDLVRMIMVDIAFPASAKLSNIVENFHETTCNVETTLRSLFNVLVALCTNSLSNVQTCCDLLQKLFYKQSPPDANEIDFCETINIFPVSQSSRLPNGFVGLKNAGATCYINSVIQQLFMRPPLREAVLCVNLPKIDLLFNVESAFGLSKKLKDSSDALLNKAHPNHNIEVFKQVQLLFGNLLESKMQYYVPTSFVQAFRFYGEQVNVREQHDAVEFLQILVDNIDEALKANNLPPLYRQIIGGTFADQKICQTCPHKYSREESFTFLSVDILNSRTLEESLEDYVRAELLDGPNAYFCEQCQKKVAAVKRTYIKKAPDILIIQLKRFGYDWDRDIAVKYDDYFEFSRQLDMTPFMLSRDTDVCSNDSEKPVEYDSPKYQLVGITVHSGHANGGHYYSFIQNSNEIGEPGKWYKFDDNEVKMCEMRDDSELKDLCFGGNYTANDFTDAMYYKRPQHKWWSAYILIYERIGFVAEPIQVLLSRLAPNHKLEINKVMPKWVADNVMKQKINYLHEKEQSSVEYFNFMRDFVKANLPDENEEESSTQSFDNKKEEICKLTARMSHYFLLQLLSSSKKLNASFTRFQSDIVETDFFMKKSIIMDILNALSCYVSISKRAREYVATKMLSTRKFIQAFLQDCDCHEVRSTYLHLLLQTLHSSTSQYAQQAVLSKHHNDIHLLDSLITNMNEFTHFPMKTQCLFTALYEYSQLGREQCRRLLFLNVPYLFLTRIVNNVSVCALSFFPHGPSRFGIEGSYIHKTVLHLIRCYDTSITSNKSQKSSVNPYAIFNPPIEAMPLVLYNLLSNRDTNMHAVYLNGTLNIEELVDFTKFMCWEQKQWSMWALHFSIRVLIDSCAPCTPASFHYRQDESMAETNKDFFTAYSCISGILSLTDSLQFQRSKDFIHGFTMDKRTMIGILDCFNSNQLPRCRQLYQILKLVSSSLKIILPEAKLNELQCSQLHKIVQQLQKHYDKYNDLPTEIRDNNFQRLFSESPQSVLCTLNTANIYVQNLAKEDQQLTKDLIPLSLNESKDTL